MIAKNDPGALSNFDKLQEINRLIDLVEDLIQQIPPHDGISFQPTQPGSKHASVEEFAFTMNVLHASLETLIQEGDLAFGLPNKSRARVWTALRNENSKLPGLSELCPSIAAQEPKELFKEAVVVTRKIKNCLGSLRDYYLDANMLVDGEGLYPKGNECQAASALTQSSQGRTSLCGRGTNDWTMLHIGEAEREEESFRNGHETLSGDLKARVEDAISLLPESQGSERSTMSARTLLGRVFRLGRNS